MTLLLAMASARSTSAATRAVQDARALILSTNYLELASARAKLERLLVEWVDQQVEEENASERAREVAALWVMYAQLDVDLRQFGHAASVFERAVTCPVAGREPTVWAEYARFCAERNRLANARKVFKRGLKTLQGEQQEALLQSFHVFAANYMGIALPLDAFRRCVFPSEYGVNARRSGRSLSKCVSNVSLSVDCAASSADLAQSSSGFHQIWFAAIDQLDLPSPATASTVSSMNDARHDDDNSMGSSTDDPAASDGQDEARPAERVEGKTKTTTTRSGRMSVAKKPFEASRSEAEKQRLRLRAERRREQVECEFCHQFFSRASKRSHSIRCKLKLGVIMSAEDQLIASAFLEKERRKRARIYRNRKARERTTDD